MKILTIVLIKVVPTLLQKNLPPTVCFIHDEYTVRLWNVDSRLSAKDIRNYLEDSDLENYRMKYNRRRGVAYVKFTTIDGADDCVKKLNNQRWGKNHVGAVYDETNPYYVPTFEIMIHVGYSKVNFSCSFHSV